MKKTLMTLLALVTFSAIGFANNVNSEIKIVNNEGTQVQETYQVRLGLLGLDGQERLSGWEDLGGFYATNLETGEVFYNERSAAVLPGVILDLPEGTYEFSALQGQGGWVGYGSVTVSLSEQLVDQEGYITVFVPVAWAE